MKKPIRLALLNPNTNLAATELMLKIAQGVAPDNVTIEPITMQHGPSFIADEEALNNASKLIIQAGIIAEKNGVDAILVAGFGDPGLVELRDLVDIPVTGIAEAGMACAAEGGRNFSVITTTPSLKKSIEGTARRYGYTNLLKAVHITSGDTETVMGDKTLMAEALLQIARRSAENDNVQVILIGGGPLASSANKISKESPVQIIEPVCEGTKLSISRALNTLT